MKLSNFGFIVRHMSKSKKAAMAQVAVKPQGPVFINKDGDLILQILAKPGAKANSITNIDEEGVGVQINARPVDGEANSELVKYIASIFDLKKNEISLEKGSKSRKKVLVISKNELTPEKIMDKLKDEIS